ncbi:MAG TPA: hypothetical protein IGS53_22320 [Leptolyngbyaceae cyanobacterium M33_DOE_097]|uniref:Uncharacterized protein n=1 Tax=Oscillatoriales cyanobacterium SpSt-418 TaxID=2282169 RepID=A0A7C3PF58_9CYAN|nr:hypothetical protein [Leptolyngbyaceae cyanobacterium M33_DOE_097]
MVRKRLSDMLREEANTPDDQGNADEEVIDVAAEPAKPASTAKTTRSNARANTAHQTKAKPAGFANKAKPEPDTELENTIAELKQALEQATEREKALAQEVETLKADLKANQAQLKSLQDREQQTTALETELAQAKATALKLAEANTELTNKLEHLQTQPQKPTQQPPPLAPAKAGTTDDPVVIRREVLLQRQRASLAHPVFPDKPTNSSFSDQDLGWFD